MSCAIRLKAENDHHEQRKEVIQLVGDSHPVVGGENKGLAMFLGLIAVLFFVLLVVGYVAGKA